MQRRKISILGDTGNQNGVTVPVVFILSRDRVTIDGVWIGNWIY
jgi:hypothetical protein